MNRTLINENVMRREYVWALLAVLAAAVTALFVNLQAGVWALVFVTTAWWVWQNPVAAISFLLVIAPVLPSFKITQTVGTLTLIKDAVIVVLFVRLFLWPLITQTLPYRRNELWWPLAALGIWTALNMLRADSLVLGVLRAREIGLYVLLYLAVLYLPWSKKVTRQLLGWGLVSFAIATILGAYQWWWAADSAVLRFDPGRNIWIPRVSSVMGHPSVFGEYLVAGACLLGGLAAGIKGRGRWAAGLGGLVVLVPIYFTYSRAVWMGLAAAGGVMVVLYGWYLAKQRVSKKRLAVGAGIGGGILVLLMTAAFSFTNAGVFVRSIFDPTYGSNEERIEFMVRLIASVSNTEALIGSGLGDVLQQNFRAVNVSGYDIVSGESRTVQLAKDSTLVDNQYLKTFVEMGLAGLLIYFWIYFVMGRMAVKAVLSDCEDSRVVGLWAAGVLGAFMLQALFIDIWDIFPTNLLFWVVAGVLAGRGQKNGFVKENPAGAGLGEQDI